MIGKIAISTIFALLTFWVIIISNTTPWCSEKTTDALTWTQSDIKITESYSINTHDKDMIIITPENKIDLEITNISVSCFKVTWNVSNNHEYEITCVIPGNIETEYSDNICCEIAKPGLCYITGLRENTTYNITVYDKTTDQNENIFATTNRVKILEKYDYINGNTNCFAYEAASGLTQNPSKSAIADTIVDPITHTGIMRNEYGDYCVAMGLYFGECEDRFLIELENGVQFTVQICDSKGYASDGEGKYHVFGEDASGKCIIEFIHGGSVPEIIQETGNYSTLDWNGLKLDKIRSICKIETDNTQITQY